MTTEERIMDCFMAAKAPLSRREISEMLGLSERATQAYINKLYETGRITKTGSSRYSMWRLLENDESKTVDEADNLRRVLNDNVADSKGAAEELETKIKNIESEINGIYVNLITILGVFVAVFSIVLSNAGIAFDITNAGVDVKDRVWGIVVTNVSTLLVVGFLLIIIKLIFGIKKE